MKPLTNLDSSALLATKTAFDGLQRFQPSIPEAGKYFAKIIDSLIGSIDGLDIWVIRDLINEEDKRRVRNATVKVINPEVYAGVERLSQQELKVLQLVGQGHRPEPIADMLGISYRTVANHKANIAAKLGLGSVRDLYGFATNNLTIL